MRLPIRHGRTEADVAMTPMIDVVFLLLIFFVCTASFQATEELLPMGLAATGDTAVASSAEVETETQRVVVRATRAGGETRWEVNDRSTGSLAEVRQALVDVAQIDRLRPVTLDVAGEVPLGDMIDVYDVCRLAGLQKIEFAVEQR